MVVDEEVGAFALHLLEELVRFAVDENSLVGRQVIEEKVVDGGTRFLVHGRGQGGGLARIENLQHEIAPLWTIVSGPIGANRSM